MNRPSTYLEVWRYARTVGYPVSIAGWLRCWGDLAPAAHPLTWGVPMTSRADLLREFSADR